MAPRPAPTKVAFSADSLFDFAKADVKPAGAQHLDKFAADVKGVDFEVITATGHTDRIGSHASNMKLSERRAESVKTYLLSKGIEGSRLTAKGYGESKPIADNNTVEGMAQNRRVEFVILQQDME